MKKTLRLLFSLALSSIIGCTHAPVPPEAPRDPAAEKVQLPDHANWAQLESRVQNLDFSAAGVTLSASTGGTSVYGVVNMNGKPVGAIIPENSATVLSGEIMAFSLARAFGVATIYQPAFYHNLTGKNYQTFRTFVNNMVVPPRLKHKAENKTNIIARFARNPNNIHTIFKEFGTKPMDYDPLVSVSTNSFNRTHILKGSSVPIANLISCTGPQPDIKKIISLNGGKNNELFLSMQLSTIFLIDALTQQWDRFSGGNLQTIVTKEGVSKFAAYDNGGTWGGPNWTAKYLKLVTRFDVNVANEILALDEFFKKGTPYLGLRNEAEFAQAMGIEKFPKALENLKKSLPVVAAHLRAHANCTFPPAK